MDENVSLSVRSSNRAPYASKRTRAWCGGVCRCVLSCLLLCSPVALASQSLQSWQSSQSSQSSSQSWQEALPEGRFDASLLATEQNVVQQDEPRRDDATEEAERGEGVRQRSGSLWESLRTFSLSASWHSARYALSRTLSRTLWFWQRPVETVSGSYLALGYAESERAFPRASSIAGRLAAKLPTREVWERSFRAHVRAGEMERALAVAERLQTQKDGHGFLARFLLASEELKKGRVARARQIVGDLSGFGDFARYGAPTYRFWLAFAEGDARAQESALQELERESGESFARLLRLYATLARGEFRATQQLLRESESLSGDLSLLWVQALHHAQSEQEHGKKTALALLEPVKNQLRVQVLFLDELSRRVESDETEDLAPVGRDQVLAEQATFFLARSLADLATYESQASTKLLFARLAAQTDLSSSFVRLVLSNALFELRQDEAALEVAAQISPRALFYRQAVYLRAEILRRQEPLQDSLKEARLEEALALLKSLQELRSDDLLAWWQAGSFLRRAEQPEQSLLHFNKAVELYRARASPSAKASQKR